MHALQVVGSLHDPVNPLKGNLELAAMFKEVEKAPMRLVLSTCYLCVNLKDPDRKHFKSYGYAELKLPAGAATFIVNGQQLQTVTAMKGKQLRLNILVQNPARCTLTIEFFGEPKEEQHSNRSLLAAAADALIDLGHKVMNAQPDKDSCAIIGQPISMDLVAAAIRGYCPHMQFGEASGAGGLHINVEKWQYRPTAAAMATTAQQQDQQGSQPTTATDAESALGHGPPTTVEPLSLSNRFESLSGGDSSSSNAASRMPAASWSPMETAAVGKADLTADTEISQLQQSLQVLLQQLAEDRRLLVSCKDQLRNFSSVGDRQPDSPEDIERSKSRSIQTDKECEQQALRSSPHTQMLHSLSTLAAAISEEVNRVADGCSGLLGPCQPPAAATAGLAPSSADAPNTEHATAGQRPLQDHKCTAAIPQGAAAVHAAAQQLCKVLVDCKGPQLAAELRSVACQVWPAEPWSGSE